MKRSDNKNVNIIIFSNISIHIDSNDVSIYNIIYYIMLFATTLPIVPFGYLLFYVIPLLIVK